MVGIGPEGGVFGLVIAGDMSILRDMEQTVTGTVASMRRTRNSINGNPRYQITLTDGREFKTYPDAYFAYGLPHIWSETEVEMVIGRRNCIESITILD